MEAAKTEKNDTQQIVIQTSNYNVTVIPVEFNRNRVYNGQNADYLVEPYSRTHDDYSQTEDISGQGTLYSVSQRLPQLNASYSNPPGNEGGFGDQVKYTNKQPEWDNEKDHSTTDDKIPTIESKQPNESAPATVPTSSKGVITNGIAEQLQGPIIPTCVYLHSRTAIMMEIEDTPTATCDRICQAIINCDELGLNKQLAPQIFTLWMVSPLLELQLKPSHKPYELRKMWRSLVEQYSHVSLNRQQRDEPKVIFQRNVFFPQHLEEKIKDQKILELLYEEARNNILDCKYPCEVIHYIMLGGIQARIELGPYNPLVHSTHYFREEQSKYLPLHVRKSSTWTWLPISSKNSAEVRLLEQFKRIPTSATNRKLMKKYLEFCWSLPFYGSAFFEGQVEQPVRGLTSLIIHQDIPVLVAINSRGIYIIDDLQCVILLGLKFEEFSWEYARPSMEEDPNCLPCLFLQFMVVENGARVSKILQVFSRQASLMDKLITVFVGQLKSADETDKPVDNNVNNETETHSSVIMGTPHPTMLTSLSNKLNRLTLATFDEDGHCIGQMGSWSFTY
ncbi:FERM domain-containing protein 8 Bili [Leptinotarsa decemlineata]|uniref:FERM domain-containing protein 8 Bili n=1 Tax=Leptinotarsa decemlineata TaxID=7539 RepID=UPI000C2520D8|nr:putative FERM domain-containing protein FRMD8P1 isoform X1 [Leptinotarsa decemlineata]